MCEGYLGTGDFYEGAESDKLALTPFHPGEKHQRAPNTIGQEQHRGLSVPGEKACSGGETMVPSSHWENFSCLEQPAMSPSGQQITASPDSVISAEHSLRTIILFVYNSIVLVLSFLWLVIAVWL